LVRWKAKEDIFLIDVGAMLARSLKPYSDILASTNRNPKHHPLHLNCGFDGDVPYRWSLGMENLG
jgi:hypothetical protein